MQFWSATSYIRASFSRISVCAEQTCQHVCIFNTKLCSTNTHSTKTHSQNDGSCITVPWVHWHAQDARHQPPVGQYACICDICNYYSRQYSTQHVHSKTAAANANAPPLLRAATPLEHCHAAITIKYCICNVKTARSHVQIGDVGGACL